MMRKKNGKMDISIIWVAFSKNKNTLVILLWDKTEDQNEVKLNAYTFVELHIR